MSYYLIKEKKNKSGSNETSSIPPKIIYLCYNTRTTLDRTKLVLSCPSCFSWSPSLVPWEWIHVLIFERKRPGRDSLFRWWGELLGSFVSSYSPNQHVQCLLVGNGNIINLFIDSMGELTPSSWVPPVMCVLILSASVAVLSLSN